MLSELSRVAGDALMGPADLDQLTLQIQQLSQENNRLIDQRMAANAGDDKLGMARQQVGRRGLLHQHSVRGRPPSSQARRRPRLSG